MAGKNPSKVVVNIAKAEGVQIGDKNRQNNKSGGRKRGNKGIIDRDPQQRELKRRLRDVGPAVIVVGGEPGTGKSALVDEVLSGLKCEMHRLEASSSRPDVMTFIQTLEPHGAGLSASQSPRIRLDAALDELGKRRVVIVIESAQHLLSNSGLRDEDLELALESIIGHPTAQVKVVLVGASPRTSIPGHLWMAKARNIVVEPLELEFYREFVSSLGSPQVGGVARLDRDAIAELRDLLRGNLRLTEILNVVLVQGGRFRPDNTIAELAGLNKEEIPQVLRLELVTGLRRGRRAVLQSLAAFGAPVDKTLISSAASVTGTELTDALEVLTNWHVVHRMQGGRYWIPDAAELLPSDADTRTGLLLGAARALQGRRLPLNEIRVPSDLDGFFAEIDVLIQAGRLDQAHGLIEVLDPTVRSWNRGDLLLGRREQVRGRLSDDFESMRNHNALGDLYSARQRFDQARVEYAAALAKSRSHDSPGLKIRLNMARMDFECNEIESARKQYSNVLVVARAAENAETEIAAEEGLADCARRVGAYATAVPLAERALGRAVETDPTRAARLSLKLARWAYELGDSAAAMRRQSEAENFGVPALVAACCDSRAALRLDFRGTHLPDVIRLAERALDLARPMRDPVVLVQARTTLGLAHLIQGEVAAATEDIEYAARYRRRGRSLVVLALQAALARRRNRKVGDRDFEALLVESEERHGEDETADFNAWHFHGLALCGLHRPGGSLDSAVHAFRTALNMTPTTPGLVDPLIYLIKHFIEDGEPQEIFAPVLEALTEQRVGR